MADASSTLELILTAKDQITPEVRGIGDKVKGVFDAIPVPVAAAGAAGAAALIGLGATALKFGADFDDAFDTIRVGTGATGKDLEGLQKDFKSVFSSIPTDMGSASTAVADLNTRLGLTGKPLQELSKQFIELTRLTGGDLQKNIEAGAQAFQAWEVSTEDQGAALDHLFKVAQSTGASFDTLTKEATKNSAALKSMGFSYEEAIVLIGQFEKAGVNTEQAMTALNFATAKFAKDGVPFREGLNDVVRRMQELGPGSEATALAIETFGRKTGVEMADMIARGQFSVEDLTKAMEDSGETILGVAADTNDMAEQWQVLKNQVLVLLEPIFTKLFSTLSSGIGTLSKFILTTKELIGPLLEGAITVDDFAANFGQFGTTAHEVGLIIGKTALWIRDNWGTLEAIFGFIHDYVKARLEGMIQYVKGLAEVITSTVALVQAIFRGDWQAAWNEMKDIAGGILDILIGQIKMMFGSIPGILLGLAGDAANAAGDFGRGIVDAIMRFLSELPGKMASKGREAANAFLDSISIAGVSAGDIVGAGASVVNWGAGIFRASGGPVSAGKPYIVGERGPEWFVPQSSGTVLPNGQQPGGGGVVVNNYGPIYARDQAEAERSMDDMGWSLMMGLQRRGYAA